MMKIFFIFMLVATVVHADEESQFAEIARLRQYASGEDESDLKVQPVLNTAQSKKKKPTKTEPNEGF
ncbi:MAG: hypothetical protein ABL930_08220 [Pseudobdellovibrio sp.]